MYIRSQLIVEYNFRFQQLNLIGRVMTTEQKANFFQIQQFFPKNPTEIINNNIANKDSKTIHDKIQKYGELDRVQRASIVRNIPVLIQQLGDEGIHLLKPLFDAIIKDKDEIVRSFVEKIGESAIQLQKLKNYEENIKTLLIPYLIFYLNYPMLEIKQLAGKQIAEVTLKLNDQDRRDFVLKHVIEMAHDDDNEDNRIVAVQLFSSMSECFGQSLCEQFIGLQILSLGEDISYKVRKQAILQLPVIAKLVNPQFFNRLFQFYRDKSRDNSNWVIRKACIDIVPRIGQLCSKQQRQNQLTEVMLTLLKDNNKIVRITAYKNLGQFIYELKGGKLSPQLLRQFCRMADSDVTSLGKDNEVTYNCAYNFPAVLDAVGKQRWEGELLRVYEKLLKIQDKKIKITLSESLHEIAKLIGEALTEKYLFKVIDIFFKDKSDQIKLGVIKHIADIMKVMSEEKRQALVGVFEQFQMDQKKWRIRECIGRQLGQLLQIYKPHIIFQYVVPILLKFCSDSVSTVREEAARKVSDFIEKLSIQQGLMIGLIQSVKAFGTSPKYTQRQSFLIMCQKLMNNQQLFERQFLGILAGLAEDKVVNVKLVLAEIIKNHIDKKGILSSNETLLHLRERLKNDPNQEVSSVFQDS